MIYYKVSNSVVQLAVERFGRIDGVVVNHGIITPIQRLENASVEDWIQTMNINAFSGLALVR